MYVMLWMFLFFFFKQKTAYEMRISDWSSDVCSSDLAAIVMRRESRDRERTRAEIGRQLREQRARLGRRDLVLHRDVKARRSLVLCGQHPREMVGDARADREQFGTIDAEGDALPQRIDLAQHRRGRRRVGGRSEEHTSELQSLMRLSYAVFCLNKKMRNYQYS